MEKKLFAFQKYWVPLVDKGIRNYKSLTKQERIWFNVNSLINAINDGGSISFYYNSAGENAIDTATDLELLGFRELGNGLTKLNNLFPGGNPSPDINERNDVINSWEDGMNDHFFEEFDEMFNIKMKDVEEKLVEYIQENHLAN